MPTHKNLYLYSEWKAVTLADLRSETFKVRLKKELNKKVELNFG